MARIHAGKGHYWALSSRRSLQREGTGKGHHEHPKAIHPSRGSAFQVTLQAHSEGGQCRCRESTVRKAIMERLLPAFSVELRTKLLSEARDAVLHSVSDRLWDWASQAPHQVSS